MAKMEASQISASMVCLLAPEVGAYCGYDLELPASQAGSRLAVVLTSACETKGEALAAAGGEALQVCALLMLTWRSPPPMCGSGLLGGGEARVLRTPQPDGLRGVGAKNAWYASAVELPRAVVVYPDLSRGRGESRREPGHYALLTASFVTMGVACAHGAWLRAVRCDGWWQSAPGR